MKRFYKSAQAVTRDGAYGIALDGRPLPTPAKRPYAVPTFALAEAIAEEWASQGEKILPSTMPLTTLAATAIDRVADLREKMIDEALAYLATDLVCYRAERPESLVARQQAVWDPPLAWLMRRYDVKLNITGGVMAVAQSDEAVTRLRGVLTALNGFELAAVYALTQSLGSLVLALVLQQGELDAETAFAASQLDELFQTERWGEDREAADRRAAIRADVAASARFIALLKTAS
jgi:chaperone required for assembly of F1-ATPase